MTSRLPENGNLASLSSRRPFRAAARAPQRPSSDSVERCANLRSFGALAKCSSVRPRRCDRGRCVAIGSGQEVRFGVFPVNCQHDDHVLTQPWHKHTESVSVRRESGWPVGQLDHGRCQFPHPRRSILGTPISRKGESAKEIKHGMQRPVEPDQSRSRVSLRLHLFFFATLRLCVR